MQTGTHILIHNMIIVNDLPQLTQEAWLRSVAILILYKVLYI
jgi:hypothetical protein